MVPPILLERLARVRRRDLAVRLAWGAVRWIALAAAALAAACLLDWIVDRWTDTPPALRTLLFLLQLGLWMGAAAALLVRPLLRRPSDRETALWTEERVPSLGHRLITAIELNQPGARTEGMSPVLIEAVTREAEERARAEDYARRVDLAPLRKGAGILAGAVAAAALLFALSPATVSALLARQFFSDRAIPRSVRLEIVGDRPVRPLGESVLLLFRASGAGDFRFMEGEVRIEMEGRPREYYPLVFDGVTPEGALFKAAIPPAPADFDVRAWLGDGRTRRSARVTLVPRPVVRRVEAAAILPRYCGLRPDGLPYEQPMPRGEVAAPLGSAARVRIEVQKPVVKGTLELLGRPVGEAGPETVLRSLPLALLAGGREGEAIFELLAGETSYRISVEDIHGFANSAPPRRGVSIVPDEPPRVSLLPERYADPDAPAAPDEPDVEGMPIPLEKAIRVAYYAAHPYGLDRARLAWRLIKAGKASEEGPSAAEGEWSYLPLGEVRATTEAGPFDLKRGVFQNTGFRDQVEFHPVPSPDPDRILGRIEGGGCFDFQTRPIRGVEIGDQIEFCIEVFARNPALEKFPGRSETRIKTFVTVPQFMDWIRQTISHETRLRHLESRQRTVFSPEGTDR
jgi:hypothetical protein